MAVLTAIKLALDEAGIDLRHDTQVQLFHNEAESRWRAQAGAAGAQP